MATAQLYGVNKRILVKEGDDVQDAVDRAVPGATVAIDGSYPGTLQVNRSQITIESAGNGTLEKLQFRGVMGECNLRGVRFERHTPVDANNHYGIEVESVHDSEWEDIDITGHGYNDAVRFKNTYPSSNVTMRRINVFEVENRAFFVIGSNHTLIGCDVHNLYRTVDQSFNDVDAINIHGPGHKIIGCYAHDIDIEDSISTTSPGRDPDTGLLRTGPNGSAPPPHSDFIQSFSIPKTFDRSEWWITDGLEIRDNVCERLRGQGLILESDRHQFPVVRNVLVVGNTFGVHTSFQVVNFRGVENLIMRDNTLIMDNITGGRFIWTVPASNNTDDGLPPQQTSINIQISKTRCIGGGANPNAAAPHEDGQAGVHTGTYVENFNMWDTTTVEGFTSHSTVARPELVRT